MGQAFWADDNYTVPPNDCEWDYDKAISYMKNLHFSLVYNKISFIQDKYGEERLKRKAAITEFTIDQFRPNWVDVFVMDNEVADETEYF